MPPRPLALPDDLAGVAARDDPRETPELTRAGFDRTDGFGLAAGRERDGGPERVDGIARPGCEIDLPGPTRLGSRDRVEGLASGTRTVLRGVPARTAFSRGITRRPGSTVTRS